MATEKTAFQTALEAYLAENGNCDEATFKALKSVFEAKEADAAAEGEEAEAEGGEDGGLKLDDATKKVFDAYNELSKDQQKQFCNAMRVQDVYFEFQQLSEDDKNVIREAIGESVDSYDAETFISVMEAAIDSITSFNESVETETESEADTESGFDQFDFLKD